MKNCLHCGNPLVNSKNNYCSTCNPFRMSAKGQNFEYFNLWKADESNNNEVKPGTLDSNGHFIFKENDPRLSHKSVAEMLNILGKGSVSILTTGGVVEGDNAIFSTELIINKSPEADLENSNHRASGWYIGIKVTAPDFYTSDAKYKSRTPRLNPSDLEHSWESLELKSFDNFKDGNYYIGLWPKLNPEFIDNYVQAKKNIVYDYIFDWNNDGEFEQTITMTIDPTKLILKNEDGSEQIYPVLPAEGEESV